MRYKGAITLESETQPPKTYREEFSTGTTLQAVSRLWKRTKKALSGARWNSLCLTLERIPGPDPNEPVKRPFSGTNLAGKGNLRRGRFTSSKPVPSAICEASQGDLEQGTDQPTTGDPKRGLPLHV